MAVTRWWTLASPIGRHSLGVTQQTQQLLLLCYHTHSSDVAMESSTSPSSPASPDPPSPAHKQPRLSPAEIEHIKGGQANLWTEYVADETTAEYMLLPRLCAMAEALWWVWGLVCGVRENMALLNPVVVIGGIV